MRILIFGINYAPELTGIGKYTGEMAVWLAEQGHTVEVITGMPYYPQWKLNSKYEGRLWHKEVIDGVKIYRCPLYIPKELTSKKRIIHEFSFIASSGLVWLRKLFTRKYDVVVSVTPPFHLGFFAILYSKLRRSQLITHIQDLQVDIAKEMGMIKNERFLKMMFSAEYFILRASDKVSTISYGMQRKVLHKGIDLAKCILFPNWVDINSIVPLSREQSLRNEFGLKQTDKVVLYSGNLGGKQGLEYIIDAARHFKNVPDLYFVIVGSGGIKEKLQETVAEERLENVLLFPLQPYEKLSALLAIADIHLVLQKKSASDLVMPSKLTGILAAGGVPLVTAPPDSALYNQIKKNNLGFIAEPENLESLLNCLQEALATDLTIFQKNARAFAEQSLSKKGIMKQWETSLQRISKPNKLQPIVPY
jgi:colanic acid biosynthesis glycosyl transferase WcaI